MGPRRTRGHGADLGTEASCLKDSLGNLQHLATGHVPGASLEPLAATPLVRPRTSRAGAPGLDPRKGKSESSGVNSRYEGTVVEDNHTH